METFYFLFLCLLTLFSMPLLLVSAQHQLQQKSTSTTLSGVGSENEQIDIFDQNHDDKKNDTIIIGEGYQGYMGDGILTLFSRTCKEHWTFTSSSSIFKAGGDEGEQGRAPKRNPFTRVE